MVVDCGLIPMFFDKLSTVINGWLSKPMVLINGFIHGLISVFDQTINVYVKESML